jgi:hypothetical protein
MRYLIKAQGCDPAPHLYDTKKEAIRQVSAMVVEDLHHCRRKFGTAVLKRFEDTVFTVQAIEDDRGPMWSRYSIHEIGN